MAVSFLKLGGLWLGLGASVLLLILVATAVSIALFVHLRRVVSSVHHLVDMVDKLSAVTHKQKIPDSLLAVVLAKYVLRARDINPESLSAEGSANWQKLMEGEEGPALTDQFPSELKDILEGKKELPPVDVEMDPDKVEPDELHSDSEDKTLAVKRETFKQRNDPAYKTMADIKTEVFDEPMNADQDVFDIADDAQEPTGGKKG